ncbi:putative pentatricopeptide repeat-containing protein [Spatholobus suberectus]|nr:putative pentatricopeptide repeat-containing protein [Spatholobus suberectus]
MRTILRNPNTVVPTCHAKQLHAQIVKSKATLSHSHSHSLAWICIIKCYASHGLLHHSLASFNHMRASGIPPDRHVFPSLLKASTLFKHFRLAQSLHASVIRLGFRFDLYTANALMNMYSKFHPHLSSNHALDKFSQTRQNHNNYNNNKSTVKIDSVLVDQQSFISLVNPEDADLRIRRLLRISTRSFRMVQSPNGGGRPTSAQLAE